MINQTENRQYPRSLVTINLALSTDDGFSCNVATRDLSLGGVCFVGQHPIAPGLKISLCLYLAIDSHPFSEGLELLGRSVWCTNINTQYQVGVAFVDLNDEQEQSIELFLSFLRQHNEIETEESLSSTKQFDISEAEAL